MSPLCHYQGFKEVSWVLTGSDFHQKLNLGLYSVLNWSLFAKSIYVDPNGVDRTALSSQTIDVKKRYEIWTVAGQQVYLKSFLQFYNCWNFFFFLGPVRVHSHFPFSVVNSFLKMHYSWFKCYSFFSFISP